MRSLVINLTRFGDLLQTQPVISGLVDKGHEVGLCCLDNFAGAAGLLSGPEAVFPLPGARLLADLGRSWPGALKLAQGYIARIMADFAPDEVINLTPAIPARLLAGAFSRGPTRGFGLDAHGFRANSTPWASFLEASSEIRGLSPFSVVDLFRRSAGLTGGPGRNRLAAPGREAMDAAEAILSDAPEGTRHFVGFQPGASSPDRMWPIEAFARLGDMLHARHGLTPVLLGSAAEATLGRAYAQRAATPFVDAMGRTDLAVLAALMTRLGLLVTNDTGTMHLAAGLDVPVAAIFLATAQPFDTGPYREESLCLEPDLPCHPCGFGSGCPNGRACPRAISPETVFFGVSGFLSSGRFPRGDYPGARAWRSVFDAEGLMDLEALSGHGGTDRAAWIWVERRVFRQFLDNVALDAGDARVELSPGGGAEIGQALSRSRALIGLALEQGRVLARLPRPALKDKFLATWRRIGRTFRDTPYLSALGHLWDQQSQEPGRDLDGLLDLAGSYDRLAGALAAALAGPDGAVARNLKHVGTTTEPEVSSVTIKHPGDGGAS